MLFGLGYDKSLSIILTNDNKKRELIIDFIKKIPKKLHIDMLNQIKKLDDNIKDSYYEEILVKGVVYFYLIDGSNKCMTIGSYMKKNVYDNSIFLLKLYPYDQLEQVNDSLLLGSVIYQYKEPYEKYINICDKVEYSLEKKSSGMNFIKNYNHRVLFNKIAKKIVVDDSLSVDEIISFEKEKSCLIRKLFKKMDGRFQF